MPVLFFSLMQVCAEPAQDTLQEHTLGAYIRRALDRNPDLVARRHMTAADKEKIGTALALPDPVLAASFPLQKSNSAVERLSFTQGIPWPGRIISERRAAEASYRASEQMAKDMENDVLFKVRVVYGRMYAMARMIALEKESLELLKRAESAALAGYATSMQSQASVLKLQLEMAVTGDRIRQFEVEANTARDELAALIDIPATNIPDPDTLPPLAVPFSVDEAQKIAIDFNPKVRVAEEEAAAARYKIGSARAMYAPDIMLGVDYLPAGSSAAMAGSGGGWMFMTGLSLPVWPWAKAAEVRMARHMEAYKKGVLAAEKTTLAAEAAVYFRDYGDAVRQLQLLDTVLIPKAQQTLTAVEEAYRTSKATLMDYIDSQRMLLDLRMQRIVQEERREKMAGEIVICCLAKY
jgi:outer membrane protein, heavy metal efflux system